MRRDAEQLQPAHPHAWRQSFWFGLLLALLELGVTYIVEPNSVEVFGTDLLTHVAIPAYLIPYLVIPFIAGYRFISRSGNYSGGSAWGVGVRVGLIGSALIAFVQIVFVGFLLYIDMNTSPSGPRDYKILGVIILSLVLLGALCLNGLGIVIAIIVSRIGGAVAAWRAVRAARIAGQGLRA